MNCSGWSFIRETDPFPTCEATLDLVIRWVSAFLIGKHPTRRSRLRNAPNTTLRRAISRKMCVHDLFLSNRFNFSAFAMTETELKAMAALASIGLSSGPPNR